MGFPRYGQEASASGVCDSHNRGWFTSLDGIMVRVGNRAPSNTKPSQLIRRGRTQMTFPSVVARPGLNCNTAQHKYAYAAHTAGFSTLGMTTLVLDFF